MTTANENTDPRSLPNLSNLLTNSAHKRNDNKYKTRKGPSASSGLKESFINNSPTGNGNAFIDNLSVVDIQLPTPPCSQSMDTRFGDETRLPISPPPEEEIRIQELIAHGQTSKHSQSRLPVLSRPESGVFRFPRSPASFTQSHKQTSQAPPAGAGTASTVNDSTVLSNLNPRKRTRSGIPPPPSFDSSATSVPIDTTSAVTSDTVVPSPNPKPRKQPKRRESGVYIGSGFKRHHERGTSTESFGSADHDALTPALSPSSLKSPARNKRHDPGVEDYTPQREQASPYSRQGCSAKRKTRVRRSATPDVRYEAPTEQFTPPRQVVLKIPSSTAPPRPRRPKDLPSTEIKPSRNRKVVKVKTERLTSPFPLPSLDFSKLNRPPSPTDDPLLLVGSPVAPLQRETLSDVSHKAYVDAAVEVHEDTSQLRQQEPSTPVRASSTTDTDKDKNRWCFGSHVVDETTLMNVAFDDPSNFDATFNPDSDSDGSGRIADDAIFDNASHLTTHPSIFDPNQSTGSHIFHSDDEEADAGEDEGEYTGRFKFYNVPVKEDPPSSATRARRDSWGRPVSPFPFARRRDGPSSLEEEVAQDPDQMSLVEESPPASPSDGRKRPSTPRRASKAATLASDVHPTVPRASGLTLSEIEARLESRVLQQKADPTRQDAEEETPFGRANQGDAIACTDNQVMSHLDESNVEEVKSLEWESAQTDDTRDVSSDARQGLVDEQGRAIDDVASSEDEENKSEHELDACPSGHLEKLQHEKAESATDHENHAPVECMHGLTSVPVSSVRLLSAGQSASAMCSRETTQFTEHYVALDDTEDDDNELGRPQIIEDDDDNSSGEDFLSPGVVEISSDDPKVAARAAAILKLHHSYVIDGLLAQRARHRSSHAFARRTSFAFGDNGIQDRQGDEILQRARRKSIATSGGVLQHRPHQAAYTPLARSVLVAPGSPAVSTILAKEALREAEVEIRAASVSPGCPRTPLRYKSLEADSSRDPHVTPSPLIMPSHLFGKGGECRIGCQKEWTKAHWKRLDTCFTDERVAVGSTMGPGTNMADVDDVKMEDVVQRFLTGTQDDEDWDRDMLLRRATALSARQRAGQGAPPSPARYIPENPEPEPVVSVSYSSALPRTSEPQSEAETLMLPPSLLAPRYAHLHEEVNIKVAGPSFSVPSPKSSKLENYGRIVEIAREAVEPSTPQPPNSHPPVQTQYDGGGTIPTSVTKRALSYLGSLLGRTATTASSGTTLKPGFGALPLPPPEMQQVARGPINTPAKKPVPKSQAPREFVHLAEIQLPTMPRAFPKTKSAREMVNLNHVNPPQSAQRPRTTSGPIIIPGRTRKDSGGSVKDLVKSFEEVQKKNEEEMKRSQGKLSIRKVTSVGNIRTRAAWKP